MVSGPCPSSGSQPGSHRKCPTGDGRLSLRSAQEVKGLWPRGGLFESRETISFEGSGRRGEITCVSKGERPESPQTRVVPLRGPVTMAFLSENFTPQSVGGCPVDALDVASEQHPCGQVELGTWARGPLWKGSLGGRSQPKGPVPCPGHGAVPRGPQHPAPRTSNRAFYSHGLLPPKAQGAYFCFSVGLTRDKDK